MTISQVKKYNKFFFAKKHLKLLEKLYPNYSKRDLSLSLKKMFKKHNYQLLVAFDKNMAVGVLGISYNFLLCSKNFLQISNFYILPEYRQKDISKILLMEVDHIAKKHNINYVELFSYCENNKSHNIYLKAGFEKTAFYFRKKIC